MAFDPHDPSPLQRVAFARDLSWILRHVDGQSRARGAEYAAEGRVVEVKRDDDGIRATVLGSQAWSVEIRREHGAILTSCSCPAAARNSMCKHVAALAFALGGGKVPSEPANPPRLVRELPDLPARAVAHRLGMYVGRLVPPPAESWRRLRDWWRTSPTKETSVLRHAIESSESDVFAVIAELRGYVPGPSPSPGTTYGQLYDRFARKAVELARRAPVVEAIPGPLDARHPGFDVTYSSKTRVLSIRERPSALLPTPLGLELHIPWDDPSRLTYVVPLGLGGGASLAELFLLRALLLEMSAQTNPQLALLERELGRPQWERLLDQLGTKDDSSGAEETIYFAVVPSYGSTFTVRAYARGVSKKGAPKWKKLSLDALARGTPLADAGTRRIARLVQSLTVGSRTYVGADTTLGHEILRELQAHGRTLFREPQSGDEPAALAMTIVAGDLSMSLDPGEDGLVRPSFHVGDQPIPAAFFADRPGARRGDCLGYVEDARIVSALVPRALERWLELWLEAPETVAFPPDALDAVAEKVAPLVAGGVAHLPKATLGSELALELEGALRIEWRPDGTAALEALASVHPSAPLVAPGLGPELYTFRHEGARVFVERKLSTERDAVLAVQHALAEYVIWDGTGGFTNEVGATLALVEFLRAHPPVRRVETKVGKPPSGIEWGQMERSLTVGREGAWFAVRGDLRLGDTTITLGEVLDAARLARRYIPTESGAFVIVPDEVQEKLLALATAAELAKRDAGGGARIHDAFVDVLAEAEKMFTRSEGVDVIGFARALATARKKKITPTIEAGALRPYQIEGAAWMLRLAGWAPGCVLADDMGLGKTVQTASVLLARRKLGPALVVAPASVSSNWKAELARFVPSLRVVWLNEEREVEPASLGVGTVVVVSYGLLARLKDTLAKVEFATVVLDEAQFLKNALAQRSSVVRGLNRKFTIALTGTPLENHLGDLWSLFDQVFPGLLGREADFRDRFRRTIEIRPNLGAVGPTDEAGEGVRKLGALSRLVAPFLLRRTRKDVLEELPPRVEQTELLELSEAEAKRYAALRRACELEFTKSKDRTNDAQTKIKLLAALTRLRQLACDVSLVDEKWTAPSTKLTRLTELATTLADEKNRLLVFSQFRELCVRAKRYLEEAGLRVAFLAGDTPTTMRKEIVDAFQRGEYDVFCISLMAGGTGLNLTRANYVVHLDPWWNPAVEEQATSRAHRMGQTEPVTVLRLVSRGTIEEGILELHGRKRGLAEAVLEGKSTAKTLTSDELLALVRYGDGP